MEPSKAPRMKDGVMAGGAGAWTDDKVGAVAELDVEEGVALGSPGMEAMVPVPGVLGGGGGTVSVMLCLELV